MREIIFRGKTVRGNQWVTGYYYLKRNRFRSGTFFGSSEHMISTGIEEISGAYGESSEHIEYAVVPESVGQFTGLTDKNGKKIFEGDTVKNSYGNIAVVEYYRGYYYPFVAFPEYTAWDEKECEVVGNAYDFLEASNKM